MQRDKTENITNEKRSEQRLVTSRCYRMEVKLVGVPIYQFRLINVTDKGASILIKDDSAFLAMIEVDQIIDVTFLSPGDSHPSGRYKIKVKHISEIDSNYNGHRLVGISILEKLLQSKGEILNFGRYELASALSMTGYAGGFLQDPKFINYLLG